MAARKWIKRLGVLAVMAGLCGIGGLGGYVWSQTVVQKQRNTRSYAEGNPRIQVPVNQVQNYPANTAQLIPPNQTPGGGMGGVLPASPNSVPQRYYGYQPINSAGAAVPNPNQLPGGMSSAPQQVFVPSPLGGMMTIPPGVGGSGVKWSKPEGEEPQWLVRGKQAIQAEDVVRRSLRLELEITLADAPLSTALENMLRPADVAYTVDAESENQFVTIEIRGLVRDGLSRVLRPLGLDYVVRPDRLEIVEVGKSHGSVRTYNLAYVVSNSDDMETVTKMVERMVEPYAWQEGGGQGILMGIGSVLVVSTTEMVHEEVEVLLGKLEAMSLQKSPRTSAPGNNSPGMGGPGGGLAAPLQTQLYRSGLAPAPGLVQPGLVQPGLVQPGLVQPGLVQPGGVQPSGVQPSGVQPSGGTPGGYGFPGAGGPGSEGGGGLVPPAASAKLPEPKREPANLEPANLEPAQEGNTLGGQDLPEVP